MKVTLRNLSRLKPYEQNPRINEHAADAVAASIRAFGFRQPIVVDADDVIIVGHTRWKAAKKLGLKRVPVYVAADMTAAQKRGYRLADNQTAALAEWNYELLAQELGELDAGDFDLEALGFPPDQLSALLDGGLKDGLTDPDAIPEPPDKATTGTGDLYVLGDHRLLCGDASRPADIDTLMAGATAHLVNTDPPYNVRVEPRTANAIAAGLSSFGVTQHQAFDLARGPVKGRRTTRKLRPRDRQLRNDYLPDAEFEKLLLAWFGEMARVLQPGRAFYIWGGYANVANYPPALAATGLRFSQTIIWVKHHPVLTRKDFMGNHEWCFYGWRAGAAHWFAFGLNNVPDVWDVAAPGGSGERPGQDKATDVGPGLVLEAASGARLYVSPAVPPGHHAKLELTDGADARLQAGPPSDVWHVHKVTPTKMVHLTEKPVELATRAMQCSTRAAEHVLDPFGGSGSTLIAAERAGRRCFMMELDQLYCDVIVQRWEAFTGRKAERQAGAVKPPPAPKRQTRRASRQTGGRTRLGMKAAVKGAGRKAKR